MVMMRDGLVVRSALVAALLFATACAKVAPPIPSAGFAGTSWQLVKFQGGDGLVQVPAERSQYTIAFSADGSLVARIEPAR